MTNDRRSIENRIDDLEEARSPSDPLDIDVEWREAAPADRPEGMTWEFDRETKTGTLTYDVWSAQRACLDALTGEVADIVAFLAGYGSGKTIIGARWLIATALQHPGSRFLAMGQDFTKARGTTFKTLFEQLPGTKTTVAKGGSAGPERSPLVSAYNDTDNRLTLCNDAVIKLGSADVWSRYAGEEFGGIWLDEPSHYDTDLHELLEMLGSRLRGVDGPKVQCWTLTGNGYNDAWEILEQRQDTTGDPIGLDIEVVRASTLENPYLADGDIERFKRQFEGTDREAQALQGEFAAAQGLVYSGFSRDTHVIPQAEARERVKSDWRIYGYDAGWNNPRVLLELGKTPYDQLVVLDEFYERESHVEDVIAWLEENDKPSGTIYCEHEPEHVDRFRREGYPAQQATKSLDAGIAEVRKRLEPDGNLPPEDGQQTSTARVFDTPAWNRSSSSALAYRRVKLGSRTVKTEATTADTETEGRVGLLVSTQCRHLIREFLGYKEDHVGSTEADDHCLDSLRYACMGVAGGGGGT